MENTNVLNVIRKKAPEQKKKLMKCSRLLLRLVPNAAVDGLGLGALWRRHLALGKNVAFAATASRSSRRGRRRAAGVGVAHDGRGLGRALHVFVFLEQKSEGKKLNK